MSAKNPVPAISATITERAKLAFPALGVIKKLELAYIDPVKNDFRLLADGQGMGFTYDLTGVGSIKVAIGEAPGPKTTLKVAPDLSETQIRAGIAAGYLVRETKDSSGRLGAVTFTENK